jgi:hypothetical protein
MDYRRLVLTVIGYLGVVNFAALWIISGAFGDAWFGFIENGHYYLAKHATHKDPLEVTPAVFALSLWHVKSQFITAPLAMLAGFLLNRSEAARPTNAKSADDRRPH